MGNNKNILVMGVDEVHKADVIGSIVLCGFICNRKDYTFLYRNLGVRDSKKLDRDHITKIAENLKKYNHKLYRISPGEISASSNIIKLEAKYINKLIAWAMLNRVNEIYIDSMTNNPETTKKYILGNINLEKIKLIIETHADERYICVGSASILAKDSSNKEMDSLKVRFNCGSGSPGDKRTRTFIREAIRNKDKESLSIIRRNWVTYRREFDNVKMSQSIDKNTQNNAPDVTR